jgi:hypothetical protein
MSFIMHLLIYLMFGCVSGFLYFILLLVRRFWLLGFWWPRSRIRYRGARVRSSHRSVRLPVLPRFPRDLVLPASHYFEVVLVLEIWCISFCFVGSIYLYFWVVSATLLLYSWCIFFWFYFCISVLICMVWTECARGLYGSLAIIYLYFVM